MKRTGFFLWKQGVREVFSLWKQFLAIIGIGAIAMTLFVGLQANADSFESRVNGVYERGNIADSYVTTNPMKGNQSDLDNIKHMFEDEALVEGRFYAFTKLNNHNTYCAISKTLPAISKPYEMIDEMKTEDGSFFYVDRLLANKEKSDDAFNCEIGKKSRIEFDLSPYVSGGLIDDRLIDAVGFKKHLLPGVDINDTPLKKASLVIEPTVTGIMNHPENVLLSTYSVSVFLLSSSSFAAALDEYLSKFFDRDGVDLFYDALRFSPLGWNYYKEDLFPVPNQILLKGKNDFDVDKANERISEYFKNKSEQDDNLIMLQKRADTSFASVMEADVLQARQLTYVFPFVFFAVAILVILTTMSQLIVKERTQIGTLKAMGLSKWGIARYYGAITTTVVGIGVIIGEILGPIIIPLILDNKYRVLYNIPMSSYQFPVVAGITTALVFLFLANLVTFLTVRKEAKLLPAESMRPPVKVYRGIGDKKIAASSSKLRFTFLMAMRNIRGNLVKSIMVILGILGCTALLCCGFGIDDTIDHGLNLDPIINNRADMTLTLTSEIKSEKMMADLQAILGENEIISIQGFVRNSSEIRHSDKSTNSYYSVYSSASNSNVEHTLLPFDWKKDELLLSAKIAKNIGASIGDQISFTLGNETIEGKVSSIVDIFYSNGVYIYADSPLLGEDEKTSFTTYFVSLSSGADVAQAKAKIKEKISYVGAASTADDSRANVASVLSSISSITSAVKIFAILLAVVVLYNISVLNFTERSRDIATMKVLGFNKLEIASSLLSETITLTLFGVLFGLGAGFPFLYLVLYINQVNVISYLYMIYPLSYFFAFLLTFAVSALINIYLASRTGKVKMVESLKSVE